MRLLRLLAVTLCLAVPVLAADSPFTGTWKFNPSKSHQIPPPVKASTAQIEATDESFKLSQDFVDDKDQSSRASFDAKYDGKDYPVTDSASDADAVSLHRVSEREITLTFKKAGKVPFKETITVSKDGKRSTLSVIDYSQSKPRKGTYIYDKQ